jgi:hypothetical protein
VAARSLSSATSVVSRKICILWSLDGLAAFLA